MAVTKLKKSKRKPGVRNRVSTNLLNHKQDIVSLTYYIGNVKIFNEIKFKNFINIDKSTLLKSYFI